MDKRRGHGRRKKASKDSDKLSVAPSSTELIKKPKARVNRLYQQRSSVDFQSFRSNVWKQVGEDYFLDFRHWLIFATIGVLMGAVAFLVEVIVEKLVLWKLDIAQMIIEYSSWGYALLTFVSFSALFGGTAAILTVFVGPGSVGSGTVELIAYCNGVSYPNFFGVRTLFVKIFGNALAVAAGLCVGKEGPLAHIGAIVGHMVLYLPFSWLYRYRNEKDKRELACAGAAAGVSAAFGSPIGGTLFIYEISQPSSFWSFGLTWKIFFCSSISTFVLDILACLRDGRDVSITNAGMIKFGSYESHPYELFDFCSFIVLGVCGGLLGSLFNQINSEVNRIRRIYLTSPWKRVGETLFLTTVTSALIFSAPLITQYSCQNIKNMKTDFEAELISYTCPVGEYSPLATLLLNSEGKTIKAFLTKEAMFDYNPLLIHFLIWFLMTILTYGTWVPAGLFLPGILIGCSLGRMMTLFLSTYLNHDASPATYGTIGAAAVLAGYTRLSFSLAVIMLETTENINLFLPIIFTLFISFAVGRLYTSSYYAICIESKSLPLLVETVPK